MKGHEDVFPVRERFHVDLKFSDASEVRPMSVEPSDNTSDGLSLATPDAEEDFSSLPEYPGVWGGRDMLDMPELKHFSVRNRYEPGWNTSIQSDRISGAKLKGVHQFFMGVPGTEIVFHKDWKAVLIEVIWSAQRGHDAPEPIARFEVYGAERRPLLGTYQSPLFAHYDPVQILFKAPAGGEIRVINFGDVGEGLAGFTVRHVAMYKSLSE